MRGDAADQSILLAPILSSRWPTLYSTGNDKPGTHGDELSSGYNCGMAPEGWHKPWPQGLLLFGIIMLIISVVETFTGVALSRRGVIERTRDPKHYWSTLVSQYLFAAFLICYYFYLTPP